MLFLHERTPRKLLGFRSGNPFKSLCALVFFCLVYLVFVMTLIPPVVTGNHDLLVYKAVRAVLFLIVILPVLFLSDFTWCKHIPFFSSPHTSQRITGIATLAVLLVCLCVNLTYLHTPEYHAAVTHRAAVAFGLEEKDILAPLLDARAAERADQEPTRQPDGSTQNTWNEQREGCGTD